MIYITLIISLFYLGCTVFTARAIMNNEGSTEAFVLWISLANVWALVTVFLAA